MILCSFLLLFTGILIKVSIETITYTYVYIYISNFFFLLRKSYITRIINFMVNERERLVNVSRGNVKVKTKQKLFYFSKLFSLTAFELLLFHISRNLFRSNEYILLKTFLRAHIIRVYRCFQMRLKIHIDGKIYFCRVNNYLNKN